MTHKRNHRAFFVTGVALAVLLIAAVEPSAGSGAAIPDAAGDAGWAPRALGVQRYHVFHDPGRARVRLYGDGERALATVHIEEADVGKHAWLRVHAAGDRLSRSERLALLHAVIADPELARVRTLPGASP